MSKVFASNEHIKRVILYGSRAKGNYKLFSDVDITLEGPELTLTDLNHLSLAIDDLLLPYQFDISIFHTLKNHDLIDHIQRIGITIFERESEWKEYKLGELTIDGKGSYGIAAPAVDYDSNKYTYLRITDINDDGTLNKNGLKSVDDKNAHKYLLQQNDIVFARTGASVGRSYFYDERDGELVYAGFLIKYSIDPTKVNPKILKFYTHSQAYYDWIQTVDNGATRGNINAQTYASMPIILPERHEQDRIVSILSSLDDKIDLLHRENATLEQMAVTLYRQWFIVEAKEEWEEGKLEDILSVKGGTTPSTKEPSFWDGDIAWTSPRDVTTLNGLYLFKTEKKITQKGLEQISSGLLPSGTLLMSSRAPVGVLAFAEIPLAINQGYIAILDDKGYSKEFIYLWLKTNMDLVHSYSNGSTFMEISKSAFKSLDISIPSKNEVECFVQEVKPYFEKIRTNEIQIRTLTKTRDGLLPKLMSGEIKL
ncbi:MAG: type I restriction enzyme, S subunit [bacterium F083]|nr:MAG: type I restriction enzyme, S subunit [bacterium F083]